MTRSPAESDAREADAYEAGLKGSLAPPFTKIMFEHKRFSKPPFSWPYQCSCGRRWTALEWQTLQHVGSCPTLEYRICCCGSCISTPVPDARAPPEAFVLGPPAPYAGREREVAGAAGVRVAILTPPSYRFARSDYSRGMCAAAATPDLTPSVAAEHDATRTRP